MKQRGGEGKFLSKLLSYYFFICTLILIFPGSVYPACTPASAELCAAVDDISMIYINGTLITDSALEDFVADDGTYADAAFPYCDIGDDTCEPTCINLDAAELALLQDSGNVISVRTLNTGYNELWVSYSLDITCTEGGHSYVTSADPSEISMYYDNSCPEGDIPQYGGLDWHDPLYDESGSGLTWETPYLEQGQKYGKRIYDPQTGSLLPALSYSADSDTQDNDCKELYMRQGFDLVQETPLPDPTFTISKTADPATNIGQNPPDTITFTLHICNTGGGTRGNPVTINEDWSDALDDWQYVWPYDYTDTMLGFIDYEGSGQAATIEFADGFPDNTCYDYEFAVSINDQANNPPTFCDEWDNYAYLSYLSEPTKVATATVSHYCPPPPDFTISKSSSITNVHSGDHITYTITLCNNGGEAYQGSMTIIDDMRSAPISSGSWQYDGPYYEDPGITGIDYYDTNDGGTGDNRYREIDIYFEQPGFTGCMDIDVNVYNTGNQYGCGPWHNDAILTSYMGLPTAISTVDMMNICTPSMTATMTRTPTPTESPTHTFTLTPTATFTMTPQPTMDVTKSANVSTATLGDIITFTLEYHNTGSITADDVQLWDTIPAEMIYINCSGGCSVAGGLIIWDLGDIASGGAGSVSWWGTVDSYPYSPLKGVEVYFANIERAYNRVVVLRKISY